MCSANDKQVGGVRGRVIGGQPPSTALSSLSVDVSKSKTADGTSTGSVAEQPEGLGVDNLLAEQYG